MSEHKIRLGITQGDINGIGWEVILKAFANPAMCELCTPIVYGSATAAEFYRSILEENGQPTLYKVSSAREARPRRLNLVEAGDQQLVPQPGTATPQAGLAAVEALRAAAADLKAGLIDAVVTAPIDKETVQGEGFHFTGHTEFFADEFGGTPLMILCSDLLRVGLTTIHVPVSEVSSQVTQEKIVERLGILRRSMIADFGLVEPRLAVLGLNPHAGDGGLLGQEEQIIIKPAVEQAAREKILAFGPFAADGFFASAGYRKYDAVLAMYHDQGLAPFKALTPDGVNFTAGLPVIRTSPDHGTAYDIAGKGIADPASMRNAVYAAIDIDRCRREWAQMSRNPLHRFEREKGRDVSVSDLPETE